MQGVHDFFSTGKGIQDNSELNRLGPWIKFIFQRIRLWEEIKEFSATNSRCHQNLVWPTVIYGARSTIVDSSFNHS